MLHSLRRAVPVLILANLSTLPAQLDWPMYQADASHSGHIAVQVGFQTVAQRWSVSYGTWQNSPVTTGGGKAYFASTDKKLVALDSSTGTEVWHVDFQSAAYVNPPSYADGKVYIQTVNHGNDTYLRCYDADNGQLVFQSAHSAQWERYLAPTIYDGNVYVNGGYYGGMYGFDGTTGAQLWFIDLAQYDEWTPAVAGDIAYAYVGGTLSAVNRHTGALAYEISDPNFSWAGWSMGLAPMLGGQNDLFVVNGSRLLRFDLLNRQIAYELTGTFSGQPAVMNGVIYVLSSGTLQARDQATGNLLWSFGVPNETLRGAVALTAGHAFVHSNTTTYAVDLATHLATWTHPAAGELTLTQGAIYVSGSDGTLTSIGFAPQPMAQRVEPPFQSYVAPRPTVTVHGSGFLVDPTGLQVSVGGVPVTNLVVIDDATLQCEVPLTAPGVYDVLLQNQYGAGQLADGFAVTPAVDIAAPPHPSGTLEIAYHQTPLSQMLALLAFDTPQSLTFPPFQGTLCIDPGEVITPVFVMGWMMPVFPLAIPIPNEPSLSGVNMTLQSVAGPSLWTLQGAFSNCTSFQIQ